MTLSELNKYAIDVSRNKNSKISSCKKKALYEIIEQTKTIKNYVNDSDRINQAAKICDTIWEQSYKVTHDEKYNLFRSVIDTVYNHNLMNVSQVEESIKDLKISFLTLSHFIEYLSKTRSWINNVSYDTLKTVFEIRSLSNDL